MKILQKIASVVALAFFAMSCHSEVESTIEIPTELCQEVSFALPLDATRTSIDPEDGRTTRWSENDNLAVWAKGANGNLALVGESFLLRFLATEWNKAYFVGNIAPMAKGEYTYYISYPKPTSIDGTMATYNVSAEQSGEYDGKYDIMVAEPTINQELTTGKRVELETIMRHKMHAIKITVPEGRNLYGEKFEYLEITFPQDVVGNITIDVAEPDAEPLYTNTTNIVKIYNDKGFDAGDDIWVFVLPGTINGDVSYRVRGGRRHSEVASYPLTRTMQAGHVTPIRMMIPKLYELYTALHINVTANNLGEDFNYFDVYDGLGNHMGQFQRNDTNKYTIDYEGEFDVNQYDNTSWRIVFDSDHAIVQTTLNMGDMTPYSEHNAWITVPYLFTEDFSSLANYTDEATTGTKTLSISGWTASRTNCKGGVIQLATFYGLIGRYQGRLDSAPISNLKKSANIKVTFDANNNISKKVDVPLQFGWGTNTDAIKAGTAIENLVVTQTLAKGASKTLTYTIKNFAAGGRLAWQTNVTSGSWTTYNYLGIDNIKIQIAE